MTDRFRELVEQNLGCAVILAGSDTDEKHIGAIHEALTEYLIPHETRIESAHNDPSHVLQIVNEYDALKGPLAYITVAGGTDALSGIVSRHTYRPVISCPPDEPNESCLHNPFLSSNVYAPLPENAARAVAQIFSWFIPAYKELIQKGVSDKNGTLRTTDEEFRRRFSWCGDF